VPQLQLQLQLQSTALVERFILAGVWCDAVVDGSWGAWSEWSTCSVSCGGGQRSRRRVCDSPPPSHGGRYCVGSDLQNAACNRDSCPG